MKVRKAEVHGNETSIRVDKTQNETLALTDAVCSAIYRDTRETQDVVPKCFGAGKHHDDILCMAYQEPKELVSASYDGDVVLWNINAERVICKLNASEECSR